MIEKSDKSEYTPDSEDNGERREYTHPPALPDKGKIPLPDDHEDSLLKDDDEDGWGNIADAEPGELIHVGLFVKPDMAIDRVAALGACVYAEAHDEYITIGDVIDAVPNDSAVATDVEADLFERFLDELFDAIEEVATAIGSREPEEAVIHCYTYSDHEAEYFTEALDRHTETLTQARAMRALCSLHSKGHTAVDQSILSPVQPIITDHFALNYPSQGLLAVADQFIPGWTIFDFDPILELQTRPDYHPLRFTFSAQFIYDAVAYDTPDNDGGMQLNLGGGGWLSRLPEQDDAYPIRKRTGSQFPLEYVWAVTPQQPEDTTPRLTPATAEEWVDDPVEQERFREIISQYYYRDSDQATSDQATSDQAEPIKRSDVTLLAERLSYTLVRLVESIPFKDCNLNKEPIDATTLADFELPVSDLPAAARDYLRIEHGNQRERTLAHYRQPLRDRTRNGRSMPIRCTDIEQQEDGSLMITGQLAYDVLFDDADTASQIARQTRLRSNDGPGSGSWRVLTRMQSVTGTHADESAGQTDTDSPATAIGELTVEDSKDIKQSPPVIVDEFDTETGTITLKILDICFRRFDRCFRVDHCGWESPTDSRTPPNPKNKDRDPVSIEPGEVYMLDPMVDDFGSTKADKALQSQTIEQNVLWQDIQAIQNDEATQHNGEAVVDPQAVEAFLDTLAESEQCLDPNADQRGFVRAVESSLVTLHGPPGTGKTDGGTAPALLARAYAREQHNESFVGVVVAPSHDAVDAVLDGTIGFLDEWRQTEDGLEALQVTRILPATPPAEGDRVDDQTAAVDVTYANYNSPEGEATLEGVADDIVESVDPSSDASQQLLFTTPTTLYHTLRIIAETQSAIDGDGAPDAMRHSAGLADIICVDEASMMDLPQWLLAGSALKPAGQTLLVGDRRQLATVTETDWTDTLRKPLTETKASLSALEYVHWLNDTVSGDRAGDGGSDSGSDEGSDGGPGGASGGASDDRSDGKPGRRDTAAADDSPPPASTDGGSHQPATQQSPIGEADTWQSALTRFSTTPDQPTQNDRSDRQ